MYDSGYGTAVRQILHFIHGRKTGLELRQQLILPVPELYTTGNGDLSASSNEVLLSGAGFETRTLHIPNVIKPMALNDPIVGAVPLLY